MAAPEKIPLVHPGITGVFMVAPSAAGVWITVFGWQLANPADAQYLATPPPSPAVDVITRDELETEFAERGESGGDTEWCDIGGALDGGQVTPDLLFARRQGRAVELAFDPGFNGSGGTTYIGAVVGVQLPEGLRPSLITGNASGNITMPLFADDNTFQGFLIISSSGVIFLDDTALNAAGVLSGRTLFFTDDEFPDPAPGIAAHPIRP